MAIVSSAQWDDFLQAHPQAHLLQTSAWGTLKSAFGWEPVYFISGNAGAQVLFRRLPAGLSVAYIPRGPVGTDWIPLWKELIPYCRRRRALILKVEPDAWEEEEEILTPQMPGFVPEGIPVQPRRTIVIDLQGSEDDWLARMKQKTRYNIRLAERKGVLVQPSRDVDSFYRMMTMTGARDGFGVHSRAYYQRAYELFHPLGMAELLMATYEGKPLAGLMVFARGERAWYFYGASTDEERNRMPTYLLQWEAMRWAASRGCRWYDLWGVPDEAEEVLEARFETRRDGLWGVYRFKRGFGGVVRRSATTREYPLWQPLFPLYRWWEKRERRA
ncbi:MULTISPECIES: peptidoglycan bridge formation glycyltransferase FemA/FemB family protein [Anaerolinea]|uniref:lipid II:glycine glycyltransferase FemX n=1 Tax=Anaerolinea TaxID=233189 RepID=UPI002622D2AD|nr:peptidoglycan bridge formation glycyltransferase FemA/FemB family protein [Anaerolinea thermophila]